MSYTHYYYCRKCTIRKLVHKLSTSAYKYIYNYDKDPLTGEMLVDEASFQSLRPYLIAVTTTDPTPRAENCIRSLGEGCGVYLHYYKTLDNSLPGGAINAASSVPNTIRSSSKVFAQALKSVGSKATMCSVMYDAANGRYYRGVSGKNNQQGNVLAAIWNSITPGDSERYEFGHSCAEVHCLVQAYAARTAPQQLQNLDGCYFIARRIQPMKHDLQAACRSCSAWIRKAGGQFIQ